jgi:hypothetical protein
LIAIEREKLQRLTTFNKNSSFEIEVAEGLRYWTRRIGLQAGGFELVEIRVRFYNSVEVAKKLTVQVRDSTALLVGSEMHSALSAKRSTTRSREIIMSPFN